MPSRSQKIRLGVFIIISSFALLVLLFVIGSQEFFKEKDIYNIAYTDVSVSGMEVGSPVKYLGIKVGNIKDIHIDPEDVSRVIVIIALEPGTPIKEDAHAEIASIGITGLKMIEIRGGSKEATLLQPGQYIRPGGSITEEITGKAEIIAEKIELVLNNLLRFSQPENLDKIFILTESATRSFDNINTILEENRVDLKLTLSHSRLAMSRIDTAASYLEASAREINRLTASDTLGQILANIQEVTVRLREADLIGLIQKLSTIVDQTNRLLSSMDHDLERGSQDFLVSMRKLKSMLEYLDEASRLINEDPSVLIRGTDLDEIPDDDLDR